MNYFESIEDTAEHEYGIYSKTDASESWNKLLHKTKFSGTLEQVFDIAEEALKSKNSLYHKF